MFTVNHLKATNRKARYPTISEKIETLLESLLNLHEELFDLIEDKDEIEMKAEQERCAQQEREIQDFLSDLEDHYYKLEAEEASSSNVSVHSMAELKQAMEEQLENKELNEEAIQFVQSNSEAMRRLVTLAHQIGMAHRIEVIKHRVRSNGSDFDEHIGELLRTWREEKPQEATFSRLCKLLRSQRINHTANQLEKQFGQKNNPPDSSGIPVDKPTKETKDEVDWDIRIEDIGQVNLENLETVEQYPSGGEAGENLCLSSLSNR